MNTATRYKTAQEIYDEITAHISGSPYLISNWYAGISKDARQRLFNEHNVSENGGYWIYRKAFTSADARMVEGALLNWGCDGGTGGGDNDALFIYAYYKAPNTRR